MRLRYIQHVYIPTGRGRGGKEIKIKKTLEIYLVASKAVLAPLEISYVNF